MNNNGLEGKLLSEEEFDGLRLRFTGHRFADRSIYRSDDNVVYLVSILAGDKYYVDMMIDGTAYNPQDDYMR